MKKLLAAIMAMAFLLAATACTQYPDRWQDYFPPAGEDKITSSEELLLFLASSESGSAELDLRLGSDDLSLFPMYVKGTKIIKGNIFVTDRGVMFPRSGVIGERYFSSSSLFIADDSTDSVVLNDFSVNIEASLHSEINTVISVESDRAEVSISDLSVSEDIVALEIGKNVTTAESIRLPEDSSSLVIRIDEENAYRNEIGNQIAAETGAVIEGAEISAVINMDTHQGYDSFSEAIGAVNDNETIMIMKSLTVDAQIELNKNDVSIIGADGASITFTQTQGRGFVVNGSENRIENLDFISTATDQSTSFNMIFIHGNDVTVRDCSFSGEYADGDNLTVRGLEISAEGYLIDNCTFTSVRQPAYVNDGNGTISNNAAEGTRGWVICQDAGDITITGNSFLGWNAEDIAIILQNDGAQDSDIYTEELCVKISKENNGCRIDQQVKNFRVNNGVVGPRN